MANILDPSKQESISKVNVISDNKGVLEVEITANVALQRELYEQIYKKQAKDVEIEGFRKGHAPRELVEPKIYSKLTEELINQLAYLMVMELPSKIDDKYLIIGSPIVEKVDFKVVESPIVVKLKLFVVTDKKIPDLNKYKVTFDEKAIDVTEKEIQDAINQAFNEWKKQTKQEIEKPDDSWAKELKIPGVQSLESLKNYIKDAILKDKILREKITLLEKAIEKILTDAKIDLPKELVDKQVETALNQKKQEVERFGISLEKYLEYYKKDLDSFKKELEVQVIKELKQEVLKQLYAKQFNIKLDKEDHVYMELAMNQLRLPAEALQDFQAVQLVAQLALTYKVFDDIAEKIGLGKIYFNLIPPHSHHEHKHNHAESHSSNQELDTSKKDSKNSSTTKPKGASKILIAD